MINIFLFLSMAFIFIFATGRAIEKLRVPWIFSALILGALLSLYNPFESITSTHTFNFLANLGMYFLLFVIGFEIDLTELKNTSKTIFKGTLVIIPLEAIFGTLLIHFAFGYPWLISLLVALSFATVGEGVLIPILDEFRAVNTKLGQMIIGIGSLDDIIEVFTLIFLVVIAGSAISVNYNVSIILTSLVALFILTIGLRKVGEEGIRFRFIDIETLFLFTLFVLFLFLGIGEYAESSALAALLAGISLKTFIPKKRLKMIESEVKTMSYGFFAPIFFLWVGMTLDLNYLYTYPLLILLVILVSGGAKLFGSYMVMKNELGTRGSLLLGTGLSARFSTSIVIIKILFESGIIDAGLYSAIVASTVLFTFIIPLVFSNLLAKWKIE